MGLFGQKLPNYFDWSLNDMLLEPAWKSAVEATPDFENALYMLADPYILIAGSVHWYCGQGQRGSILTITPNAVSVAWATKKEIKIEIETLGAAEWWVNWGKSAIIISFTGQDLTIPASKFLTIPLAPVSFPARESELFTALNAANTF